MKKVAIILSTLLVIVGFILVGQVEDRNLPTEYSLLTAVPFMLAIMCAVAAVVLCDMFVWNEDKKK